MVIVCCICESKFKKAANALAHKCKPIKRTKPKVRKQRPVTTTDPLAFYTHSPYVL